MYSPGERTSFVSLKWQNNKEAVFFFFVSLSDLLENHCSERERGIESGCREFEEKTKRQNTEGHFKYNNLINYTLFDSTKQSHTVRYTTRHSTAAQAYDLGHN